MSRSSPEPREPVEYTRDAQTVLDQEDAILEASGRPRWGLAISGGGIRSASFGLGVIQGLVAGGVLERIRYLSTVSGGGYIGSSLTWFLHSGLPDGRPAGTRAESFPFSVGGLTGPRRPIVDFLRNGSNYLLPGKGLNAVSLFGVLVRSMSISLGVYLGALVVVMYGLRRTGVFDPADWTLRIGMPNGLLASALGLAALILVSGPLFTLATWLVRHTKIRGYQALIRGQVALGLSWTAVFALLLVGSIPLVAEMLQGWMTPTTAGGASTVGGSILGAWHVLRERAAKVKVPGWLGRFRVVLASAALIYGLLLLAFGIAGLVSIVAVAVLLAVVLLVGAAVNLNHIGFHRMYRNRLMEAMMPGPETGEGGCWGPAPEADKALLEEMYRPGVTDGPYHIINTNLVLVDSRDAKKRGRGGDSFVLSPLYCGSEATGWRRTTDYMKRGTYGMTLPTAMAISGAALNPRTGSAGRGPTRNRLVSALLSLLNLRLGYWAPNPSIQPMPFAPNLFFPGLKGVAGAGFDEARRAVELSDGGHFENLALYELVRRRLELVIVSDGAMDPGFGFADLASAIERVRIDFGALITFEDPELDLSGLLPGTAAASVWAAEYGLARRGYAVGKIFYADRPDAPPDEPPDEGVIVYLKSTLTAGLTHDLYGYKRNNPAFPDESTSDQFFDEPQFEAYRVLGLSLTMAMLWDNSRAESPWIPLLP